MERDIDSTIGAIKELVNIFYLERLIYLIITIISLLVLIITAIFLIINSNSQENTIAIMGLFSSTGGIFFSAGRLLTMWSEAMRLIQNVIVKGNG